jgi:signal transduction histidine kinase
LLADRRAAGQSTSDGFDAADDARLLIAVTDDGPGIPAQDLANLIERFF